MQITITTDSNPEAWGDYVTDETAERAADALANQLAAYARTEWPTAEVEARSANLPSGAGGGRVEVNALGATYTPDAHRDWQTLNAQEEEVATAINEEWQRIWVSVLAEYATDADV